MRIIIYDAGRRLLLSSEDESRHAGLAGDGAAARPVRWDLRDEWRIRDLLRRWFPDGVALTRLRAALVAQAGELTRQSDEEVVRLATLRLACGAWRVYEGPAAPASAASATSAAAAAQASAAASPAAAAPRSTARRAPRPAPPDERTWIEIVMVGEDDAPIPFLPYRVRLPNAAVVQGRLDENGYARIDDISPPGDCRVSFPDLDLGAWAPR
jgi:hypothetical protein